jgi:5-deoxy-glucuronate isomerase
MIIKQLKPFKSGYNSIVDADKKYPEMLMDFGLLELNTEEKFVDRQHKERAFLLISGTLELEWDGGKAIVERGSVFDEAPSCLHVPSGISVTMRGCKPNTEVTVHRTDNDQSFSPKLFRPQDCQIRQVGVGTVKEMATRTVRTVFDKSNRPQSNLVLGETINLPGRWSGYPPHYHPQPEIYLYKFNLENGFGYAELGDEVYKVKNNDVTLMTDGISHPQVAAPGYAMYYLWVIRHLDGLPYTGPIFAPEYLWLNNKDAPIWPEAKS